MFASLLDFYVNLEQPEPHPTFDEKALGSQNIEL